MVFAGILAAGMLYAMKRAGAESSGGLSDAIWKKSGELPIVSMLIRSIYVSDGGGPSIPKQVTPFMEIY